MARVRDLWYRTDGDGKRVPTSRHPGDGQERAAQRSGRKRWLAVWVDGDGRERTRAFETKAQAELFARNAQVDIDRGGWLDPDAGRQSLRSYATQWLNRQTTEASTRESYGATLRLYVLPGLGDLQLRKLSPGAVKEWHRALQRRVVVGARPKDGSAPPTRTLAPATIEQAHRVLVMVLNAAMSDGIVSRNVAQDSSAALPKRHRTPVTTWPLDDVQRVYELLPERYRATAAVMAWAGLRQGEAFGLAVEDIDFLRRVLHVRRQVRIVGAKLVYAAPKHGSTRKVPMSEHLALALAESLRLNPATAVTMPSGEPGGVPQTHRLVFTTRESKALNRNYFNTAIWKRALSSAGIEPSRVNGCHVLRHTFAATLLANGVGIPAVAEWLGHSDPAFTLRVYGHLVPDAQERSRRALNSAFDTVGLRATGTETELSG